MRLCFCEFPEEEAFWYTLGSIVIPVAVMVIVSYMCFWWCRHRQRRLDQRKNATKTQLVRQKEADAHLIRCMMFTNLREYRSQSAPQLTMEHDANCYDGDAEDDSEEEVGGWLLPRRQRTWSLDIHDRSTDSESTESTLPSPSLSMTTESSSSSLSSSSLSTVCSNSELSETPFFSDEDA